MRGSAIGGLFACGLDTPFTAIYERQERCIAQSRAAGVPWLPYIIPTLPKYTCRYQMAVQLAIVFILTAPLHIRYGSSSVGTVSEKDHASTEDALLLKREEASVLDDSAALAEDAVLGSSGDWDSLFGVDSREDTLDFLDDDIFEEQVRCFKVRASHGAKKMSLFGAVSVIVLRPQLRQLQSSCTCLSAAHTAYKVPSQRHQARLLTDQDNCLTHALGVDAVR